MTGRLECAAYLNADFNVGDVVLVEHDVVALLVEPLRSPAPKKLHTWSSSGPHIFGNSAHVAAAATTAVGVGSTVFTVTSTVMARSIRLSGDRPWLMQLGRTVTPRPVRELRSFYTERTVVPA